MRKSVLLWIAAPFLLAACDPSIGNDDPNGFIAELPEAVIAISAAGQDLSAVRIDPIDGCYVYLHVGVVESTFIPLRATNGRPICARAPTGIPVPALPAES